MATLSVRLGSLAVAVLPVAWLVIVVVPIYYMVVTAVRPAREYLTGNPWLPSALTWDNFAQVLNSGFAVFLRNSVIVTVGTVACQLVVSLLAAYGINRSMSGLASRALAVLLLGLAIPVQAAIIPLFLVITRLGLYDTLLAVILPAVAFNVPISILILLTYLRDIPSELYDAMESDGAGPFRILWQLVVPLSAPALTTVAIYNALAAWNGFLFPLILTQSTEVRVVPVGLYAFKNDHAIAVPAMLAAVLLSATPLLIAYVVGRRQMLRGLAAIGA